MSYVCLEVEGLNVERFINFLVKEKIYIRNLKRIRYDYFCLEVQHRNLKKVLEMGDKLCYNISVKKVKGMQKIFNFFMRRIALCVSVILALLFVFFTNNFIFQFEISGLEQITENEIYEVLEKNNIGFATHKQSINLVNIENLLMGEFENISLISTTIVGNTLFINIKESVDIKDRGA